MVNRQSPDAVSELLGLPPAGQPGQTAQAQPPLVTPASVPSAETAPPQQTPQPPAELPTISDPTQVVELFYRQHGRRPLAQELMAIQALPVITRQLGRRPTKVEMLAFLDSRNETPPTQAPQFREVTGDSGTVPSPGPTNATADSSQPAPEGAAPGA